MKTTNAIAWACCLLFGCSKPTPPLPPQPTATVSKPAAPTPDVNKKPLSYAEMSQRKKAACEASMAFVRQALGNPEGLVFSPQHVADLRPKDESGKYPMEHCFVKAEAGFMENGRLMNTRAYTAHVYLLNTENDWALETLQIGGETLGPDEKYSYRREKEIAEERALYEKQWRTWKIAHSAEFEGKVTSVTSEFVKIQMRPNGPTRHFRWNELSESDQEWVRKWNEEQAASGM